MSIFSFCEIFVNTNASNFLIRLTAMKIHVSPQTKEILSIFGNFQLKLRGPVKMKVSF